MSCTERIVSLSTPNMSCMSDIEKNSVYEPAEDTFLLLDALQDDYHYIRNRKPTLVLEVGCGSGVVSSFMWKLLEGIPAHIMCTDVNIKATVLSKKVANLNHAQVEPIASDLTACFGDQIARQIDILIFNPPYVVTPSSEVGTTDLSASWAGGVNGREVLDRLLPQISDILSNKGIFYLVTIKENNIDEITTILKRQQFSTTIIKKRRSGPELLMVLRIERISK